MKSERKLGKQICTGAVVLVFASPVILYYVHPFLDYSPEEWGSRIRQGDMSEIRDESECPSRVQQGDPRCYEVIRVHLPDEGIVPGNTKVRSVDEGPAKSPGQPPESTKPDRDQG